MKIEWEVGQKVRFNAKDYNWQDWLGTLRTCENPQVAIENFVVRIYFIENSNGGLIVAYGVVVSEKTSEIVKRELDLIRDSKPKRKRDRVNYTEIIRSNIRGYK